MGSISKNPKTSKREGAENKSANRRVTISYVNPKGLHFKDSKQENKLGTNNPVPIKVESQNELFHNVKNIFMKVFLNGTILKEDLQLKAFEVDIFRSLLIRKGFPVQADSVLTPKFLNKIKGYSKSKKRE